MSNQTAIKDIDSATPDELGLFHHHFSITMELEKHPLIMAMSVIAVLLLVYHLFKSAFISKQSSSQPLSLSTTSPGIVPVDVTNTTPIPVSQPPAISSTYTATIRPRSSSKWDQQNVGPNIYNTPYQGNSIVGHPIWGSTIQVTSSSPQAVSGGSWYEVVGGQWILSQDIVSVK